MATPFTRSAALSAVPFAALLIALTAAPTAARATPVVSDTATLVGLSACTDGTCQDKLPRYAYAEGGPPGAATASSTASNPSSPGDAGSVSVTLGTPEQAGAPILHASASSSPGQRNLAAGFALQSYTWDGVGSASRTFGGALTYSQTLVAGSYPLLGNGVSADIYVYTAPLGAQFDPGATVDDNVNSLYAFDPTMPGWSLVGSSSFSDTQTNLNGDASLAVDVSLSTDVTYWVYTDIFAIATNGSTVDASHTLLTSWNDPTGLTPATTVPEPGALGLLGAGIAALILMRRRRWRSSAS